MSPFAELLHDTRLRYGFRQGELAQLIGCKQSFISAIEVGLKDAHADFLGRLASGLNLTHDETVELQEALNASQRKWVIPADSSTEMFLLIKDLRAHIHQLSLEQVKLIRSVIDLPISADSTDKRIRRAKNKPKQGVTE